MPVVVLVAVGIRVALLIARGLAYNVPDGVRSPIGGEVGAVARSIASGHGFGSPVLDAGETGPTAMVSPLYPGLLGAVFSLSGIFTVQSAAIILFFNCVVSGLTCVPLMYAARRLYGPAVALACGVAWAASPYAVWHAAYAVQDASLTAFVFTAVLWAVLRLPSEQKIWPWAALGALLGLLVLMNAQAAASTPFILGWLVWRRMRNGLRWRVPVAVAVGVCALFALPWMVRNSIVFGRPMFIRSNLGGELRLGFNAQCQGPATLSLWVGRNPEETKRYRELGEMAYFDEKAREATAFIRANPLRALALVARRAVFAVIGTPSLITIFWLDGRYLLLKRVAYASGMVLAVAGIFALWRRHRPEALLFAAILISYHLPEIIVYPTERHRHVVEPVMILAGIYAAALGCRWVGSASTVAAVGSDGSVSEMP